MARIRRFPAEDRHGDVVASAQVSLHLKLQIVERIEAQVVIESFMIVSVAALDFAVVPRRSRADRFVRDAVFLAKQVQRVYALRLRGMAKLAAVVGLHDLRRIAEKGDCALHKIHRREAALLLIRVDKPLPAGFFDHGVLEKRLAVLAGIADFRHVFHVHLPFHPQFCGRIVLSEVLRLLFRRFRLSAVSETHEDAVQRARMPAVRLFLAQLSVHFAYADVGIAPVQIANPGQFFLRMRVRVRRFRTVRLRFQRFTRPVVLLIPPHQRRFRDVIPPADELHVPRLSIQPDRIQFCRDFVLQIPLVLCYTFHGD